MAGDIRSSILSRIKAKENIESATNMLSLYSMAERERIELEGRRKFFQLRSVWSNWIITWITIFIFFHIGLAISVGRGALNFQGNEWLLPSIIIENFLQILGMGVIVVKFLYPQPAGKH